MGLSQHFHMYLQTSVFGASNGASLVSIACSVLEIWRHKSDGVVTLFSESTEMGLSSGAGPIIVAPCVPALQALESDHLETLQA